jgi:hypothetical protein
MKLRMLSDDEKLGEIRRLYFTTTRETIHKDLESALDLLRSMSTEQERERATVFMDGLSQMRSEWAGRRNKSTGRRSSKR